MDANIELKERTVSAEAAHAQPMPKTHSPSIYSPDTDDEMRALLDRSHGNLEVGPSGTTAFDLKAIFQVVLDLLHILCKLKSQECELYLMHRYVSFLR